MSLKALEIISEKILTKIINEESVLGIQNVNGIGCIEGTTGITFIGMNGTFNPKKSMVITSSEKITEKIKEVANEN